MKKTKQITLVVYTTATLLSTQITGYAQYNAAKGNRATENIRSTPKQLNTDAVAPQSCSSPQKVYCDSIKNLDYIVCLPIGTDVNAAKKIAGNISFTNTDKDGAYYFTLVYSWKGTLIKQENTRVAPGVPVVIKFTLDADLNYSGSINNVQVWLQSCKKLYDPK
jgi:hypothetical protein